METIEQILETTYRTVREFSYNEKKSLQVSEEERINEMLDAINDFKKNLSDRTSKMTEIIDLMERVTWVKKDPSEESLMMINDVISSSKDLRSSLIRLYISFEDYRKKGIVKEEIKAFKHTIDDFTEMYEDLEAKFFFLPKMPDFQETTRQLSLV